MMMMIEPFDVWNWGKTENDYNKEFNDWWRADITNMVKHYRNNASVMLWSSGNEVWNQVLDDGIAIVKDLQALFHQLDPTRPVTNGMDQAKAAMIITNDSKEIFIENGTHAFTLEPGKSETAKFTFKTEKPAKEEDFAKQKLSVLPFERL